MIVVVSQIGQSRGVLDILFSLFLGGIDEKNVRNQRLQYLLGLATLDNVLISALLWGHAIVNGLQRYKKIFIFK